MEIRVEKLRKTFESSEGVTVTALNDVDLTVPNGTVTTLLGPSGCGKTTLLRCIAGLETPDSGTIRIGDAVVWQSDGRSTTSVTPDKRGIGMVFQTYAIWPHMTVFENVAYPLQSQGVPRSEVPERVAQALKFVQLSGYEKRPATALSGGQQQRVSLARAIVSEPRVILFDEPLSNLDAKLREETRAELRELLTRLGITSLYVTHDRFEALALSDDVVVMQSGNIVQRGSPDEVYFRSNTHFVMDFMGKANFLKAQVVEAEHSSGYLLAQTEVGPLLCERHADLKAGQEGQVAVRMEFLQVVGAAESKNLPANHVTATVTSEMFLGEYREVDLLAGETRLHLRQPAMSPLTPGTNVELRFEPSGCRFITA
ncbi:MAG: ABC transporter ATP-binding protein [Trueperaceae bacterium]|nr:ABC transporter ATP-binding protein [Trueperaceae bacterium]